MLHRSNGKNRAGDLRGINGAQGQRASNGRFCSKRPAGGGDAPAEAVDASHSKRPRPPRPSRAHQAHRAHRAHRAHQARDDAPLPTAVAIPLAPLAPLARPLPLPLPPPAQEVLSTAKSTEPTEPTESTASTVSIAPSAPTAPTAPTATITMPLAAPIARAKPLVASTASTETDATETLVAADDTPADDLPLDVADLVRMASGPTLFQHRFVCSFDDLSSRAVLDAIEKRDKSARPTTKKATYFSHLIYQCAFDRRDQGGRLLPHVVAPNVMLPIDDLRVQDGDVTIETIPPSDLATQAACARIFVDRGLFKEETYGEVLADMLLYTAEPFHFLAATRGGVVVGAVVFRAHELNKRLRLVTLELLATASAAAPGVGSALMRVMRELSQVTPRSIGFVAAACLKTAGARRFYTRKLPEVDSPLARALMVSVSVRDPDSILKNHLELRCVTVMP